MKDDDLSVCFCYTVVGINNEGDLFKVVKWFSEVFILGTGIGKIVAFLLLN